MTSAHILPTQKQLVIPIATTVPVSAIVFAFCLGPSPEKGLESFYFTRTDQQAQVVLAALGPRVVPLVAANLLRGDLPRRPQSIEFLGVQGGEEASVALRALVEREEEPTELRVQALRALHRVAVKEAHDLASIYRDRSDALGESAREISGGDVEWISTHRDRTAARPTLGRP